MKKMMLKLAGLARYLKKWLKPSSCKFKTTFSQKLSVFFYGFIPDNSVFYDFKKYDRRDYLTDLQMYTKAILINTGYTELMNNKLVFTDFIGSRARMAETLGYILHGKVVPLGNHQEEKACDPIVFFEKHLSIGESLMIKKFDAGSGEGIYKLTRTGSGFVFDGKEQDSEKVVRTLRKLNNYMISAFVPQADYSDAVYSGTVNTVKFITMIDPDTQEPFLAACFHRFGTDRSVPVDNVGFGSCAAHIDTETGLMSPVYLVRDHKLSWITEHPDSGARIDGTYIPNFAKVRDEILALHNSIKYIKYIAWDVVIQNDGFVLLEGNANTDMAGIQPFGPFLRDPRVRRFYQYHKVVK